eukprot:gene1998-2034_t
MRRSQIASDVDWFTELCQMWQQSGRPDAVRGVDLMSIGWLYADPTPCCPGIDENGALMITRAKRVLPGMVMTLLLSAPAFAAGTGTDKIASAKVDPKPDVGGARIPHSKGIKTTPAAQAEKSATKTTARTKSPAVRTHTTTRNRSRDVTPAMLQSANGRIIRRASVASGTGTIDHNLIDDGTLWRERGSLATWQQTGMASWYGGSHWQGHQTSSGSRYNQNELTAAHATLPLGTKVKVTTHSGGRSVIVTINDRPGTRTRIIDLSRQAAKELGILDAGVAMCVHDDPDTLGVPALDGLVVCTEQCAQTAPWEQVTFSDRAYERTGTHDPSNDVAVKRDGWNPIQGLIHSGDLDGAWDCGPKARVDMGPSIGLDDRLDDIVPGGDSEHSRRLVGEALRRLG